MEPTAPRLDDALRRRLADLLAMTAIIQVAHRDRRIADVRDGAARAAVIADDLVGIAETMLARGDEARWTAAVDRATGQLRLL